MLFSTIYPYVRGLLGDVGLVPIYTNAQINQAIALGLLEDATFLTSFVWGGPPMAMAGSAINYSVDPTNPLNIIPDFPLPSKQGQVDQYRISIRAALAMVRPTMAVKKYRSPVMQVERNMPELIAELKYQLQLCTSENVVLGGQSDTDQWLYGFLNFLSKMQGKI